MAEFADNAGRVWTVPPLDLRAAVRVAKAAGVNVTRLGAADAPGRVLALWVLLRDEADKAGVGFAAFFATMDGGAVGRAVEAVGAELSAAAADGRFPPWPMKVWCPLSERAVVIRNPNDPVKE